jgi:hypothetical protein
LISGETIWVLTRLILAEIGHKEQSFSNMKTKRSMEITVETHAVTVIRINRRQTVTIFCDICRKPISHFSVFHAAAAMKLSETAVFRLAERGRVHSMENSTGSLFICGNSLTSLTREINTGQKMQGA